MDIETRLALLEQKTIDMMDKFINHMDNEEQTQQKTEKMLSDIYEILRAQQKESVNDGKELEKKILDHIEKYYATKTETTEIRSTAYGVSFGISLVIGLISYFSKG